MPLHLKLRRGERLLVNGAVLEIGTRFGEVILHNQSHCLRENDLLREEDASTPTRRLYFRIQAMIVSPDEAPAHCEAAWPLLGDLEQVFSNPDVLEQLGRVRVALGDGDAYRAMGYLRAVLKYEDMLMAAAKLQAARALEQAAHARAGRAPKAAGGAGAGPSP